MGSFLPVNKVFFAFVLRDDSGVCRPFGCISQNTIPDNEMSTLPSYLRRNSCFGVIDYLEFMGEIILIGGTLAAADLSRMTALCSRFLAIFFMSFTP